jgi:hypothetical protein
MTRILWIMLLVVSLFIFAGFTIMCVVAWITHKHLNSTGMTMLVTNGYASWCLLGLLRKEVHERRGEVKNEDAIAGK